MLCRLLLLTERTETIVPRRIVARRAWHSSTMPVSRDRQHPTHIDVATAADVVTQPEPPSTTPMNTTTIRLQQSVTRTMSVSWQNGRREKESEANNVTRVLPKLEIKVRFFAQLNCCRKTWRSEGHSTAGCGIV